VLDDNKLVISFYFLLCSDWIFQMMLLLLCCCLPV